MKINKIEIYNLNSLKGYWCIDLTAPEYEKAHNQFVIHGGTGSGKTTILDAITLALYGRTPRLETKIIEEMMTKHTTSCMASVTYECKLGNFKSTFTLNRAHDKLDGNIKHGFHILNLDTNEDTGNINAFDKMETATRNNIQLGYDQFCRSILLAQGSFDIFITSTENERAGILGKMSGIDYQDIGKEIWYKAKSKIGEYTKAKENLDRIDDQLLKADAVDNLNSEKMILPEQNKKLQKQINDNNDLMNWVNQVNDLLKEKNTVETERKEFEARREEFKEQKKKLDTAEQALNCEVDYQKYILLESANNADLKNAQTFKNELKKAETEFNEKQNCEAKAVNLFNKKTDEKKNLEKIWKKVSTIDIKIDNLVEVLKDRESRFKKSEEAYTGAKDNINALNTSITDNSKLLDENKQYVSEHEIDEQLIDVISGLNIKKDAIERALEKIASEDLKQQKADKIISELTQNGNNLQTQFNTQNEELQQLLNTEYYTFALLIREKLEDGKPCPVCGSNNHPLCKNEDTEKTNLNKNASKVTELVNSIETLKEDIKKNEKEINNQNTLINHSKEEVDYERKTLTEAFDVINESIKNWNQKVEQKDDTRELNQVIEFLEKQSKNFISKKQSISEIENAIQNDRKLLESIHIEQIEKQYLDEKKAFETQENELKEIKAERYDLYSDKNVEAEEKKFNTELEETQNAMNDAKKETQKVSEALISLKSKIMETDNRIESRKVELDGALKLLNETLQKNNFKSVEAYLECRITREEIDEIRKINDQLNIQDTATKTNVKTTENRYNEIKKQNKTDKSIDDLKQLNDELENQKLSNAGRLQEIDTILKNDSTLRSKYEENKTKLEAMQESYDTWTKIQSMIGKKDGETFQKYVQTLAFRKLLVKANNHLKSISERYELIQIPGKVDCLVHDEDNYPDPKDDRPLANMSGGEKFIISLSLALGIAEMASRNVKVDSLFLDEGFGTLSGEPLVKSIDALKKLQTTGKMLGIITHMPDVINSFDQRIEAKPMKKNSGYSQLEGAGITYSKTWNKD